MQALFAFAGPAAAVPSDPTEWGKVFCSETAAWTDGAAEGYSNLIQQTTQSSISAARVRALYIHYLKSGVSATKRLIRTLIALGEPAVANGKKVQAALLVGLAGSGTNLSKLVDDARALDPSDRPSFLAGLKKLDRKFLEFTRPFDTGLATADEVDADGELAAILNTVPECASTPSTTTVP